MVDPFFFFTYLLIIIGYVSFFVFVENQGKQLYMKLLKMMSKGNGALCPLMLGHQIYICIMNLICFKSETLK